MAGDCCNCSCDTGRLPYTLTVNASGFEKCSFAAGDFTILSVLSCFGAGALVRVTTNYDYPNQLKILTAEVLEPGSGYAVKGRVQPTIELTAPTLRGADCTYTPTFTELTLKCSECLKWWTPTGATIECEGDPEIPESLPEPGSAPLSMRVVNGCATVNQNNIQDFNAATATLAEPNGRPLLTVNYHRAEPTLTASVSGGSGGAIVPVLEAKAPGWAVASVTVNAGGSGYTEGQAVQFSTPHMEESPAAARAFTAIAEPQMSASVFSFAGGSGAELSVELSETTAVVFSYNLNGEGNAIDVSRPRFVVSGVTVESGGSGYAVGDEVRIATTNGQSSGTTSGHFVPPPRVSSVSGGGAITGISFTPNSDCKFWRDTGVVEFVEVTSWGAYCLPVPYEVVAEEGTIGEGGTATQPISLMHAEDAESEPCVAEPYANYNSPFYLDEGQLSCTVSTNAEDGTFGQIVSVAINDDTMQDVNDGSTYPYYRGCIDGEHVLFAEQTSPLVTFGVNADYGNGAVVLYGYGGTECSPSNHLYQQRVSPKVTASNGVIVTLEETTDDDGLPAWRVASLSIAGGCAEDGTPVVFTLDPDAVQVSFEEVITDTVVLVEPEATIQADENNTITGVTIDEPGLFYRKFPWDGQPGEIQRVTVVNGGSGYAVIGREQPQTFTFNPAGPWTPTLEQDEDDAGRPLWTVESIAVGAGSGFDDGQWLRLQQSYPEVGDTYSKQGWGVVSKFSGTIRTKHEQPIVTASVTDPSGSGATLAVTLEQTDVSPPSETWRVASVAVTSGGSGYFTLGATVSFNAGDRGVTITPATATPVLGANGEVISVEVTSPGEYWRDSGVPDRVEIENGGKLWRENKALPPHVADVTVAVNQVPPSEGENAELAAVIETDPYSQKFGQLVGVTVVNQGSNYTPFIRRPGVCRWQSQCYENFANFGYSGDASAVAETGGLFATRLVVRARSDGSLFVGHVAPVSSPGSSDPADPYLPECSLESTPTNYAGILQFTDSPPEDCSSFSDVPASDPNTEGTFTVSAGGVPTPEDCLPCGGAENCPGRPVTLAATATVSITVPTYPNVQPQIGLLDLPVCCEGEHTAEDIPLEFSCNDPDSWLSGTATLDKPGGCVIDTSITCEIKLVQDEACDLFLEVTFTGNCKERYEENGDPLERAVVLAKTIGPLDTTTDDDGLLVPDDIVDLDISFDEENDYPATISVTFTT